MTSEYPTNSLNLIVCEGKLNRTYTSKIGTHWWKNEVVTIIIDRGIGVFRYVPGMKEAVPWPWGV